ncbi:hypothetical protein FQR65_LT07822 [Abscondita terminalis]|nr:hypothetical protein FQR65_LT07822 [Abscondita terminalis]
MAQCNIRNSQSQSESFNYYLTVNINNICRICLEKGPKLMPIFDPIKPPHFSNLIMACACVQVLEGDGLPPYICQKCISKLNVAFQFKSQCESSDAKLRQCFENLHNLPAAPDLSSYIEDNKHSDSLNYTGHGTESQQLQNNTHVQLNNHLEDVNVVQDMNNVSQVTEPQLQNLENVPIVTESALNAIDRNDFQDIKIEYNDLKPFETQLKVNDMTLSQSESKTKFKKQMKPHQCDTCGKIFRTKPGLIHHIRIHTGERPYVCHLCDKRFINGGHLHTHMRTHTGEKNHICAACNKAFATAQQLTKHTIAIHTSERPYGCTYCLKRFASSSNLNTHVRIHTGEKNYHCDQCAKAFSTKGQLYQHMLVHTGEKAFLCEYCNKRFSQKAHLIRHLKMHKN